MRNLTIEDRKENFERKFPNYASLVVHNDALYTTWVVGADYRKIRIFTEHTHIKSRNAFWLFSPTAKRLCTSFREP